MDEIKISSKESNYDDLTYCLKKKNLPKGFIGFKAPLSLLRRIKESLINLKKARRKSNQN